jgi:hypothetical protein
MALVLNDRVLESSTSIGTGPITLAGAIYGFQSFSAGVGASNTTYYTIVNTTSVATEWEVGLGTLDAGGTVLTRTTVYKSSNAGAAVVFTAGTKNVFVTYPSNKSVNYAADGSLAITGATTLSSTETITSATNSPLTVNNGGTGTPLANSVASFFGNVNSYSQINYQNLNAGTSASSDLVLTADNGTDLINYVNFGINSSTYNLGTFTITGANDGYIYSQSTNLAIGVATAGKSVKFFQGGTLAANEVARFAPTTNNLLVGTTTDSATSKIRAAGIIESARSGAIVTATITFTGSGLVPGTYTDVPVVGGSGTGAIASSVTVILGGTVTAITFPTSGSGLGYVTTDLLSIAAANLGGTGTGPSFNPTTVLTGGFKFPDGTVQTSSAGVTSAVVGIGSGTTYVQPIQSFTYSFTDANATTANHINIEASGKSNGALIAVGAITPGSGYTNGTYTNVSLLGGSGTGAIATSIVVSVGAVTSITLAVNGTGSGYAYGDTFFVAGGVLGAGSGFSVPAALIAVGGDELEMDGIKASAQCLTNGVITVYVDASPGYIAGGRTFIYTLG